MRITIRIGLVGCLLLQVGCASFERFPVEAELMEESIRTTVDSQSAQYYLNHYLQGERLDADLDARIDAIYRDFPESMPSREQLRRIAQRFSNDFAALFLADRLWQQQGNRMVQRSFHNYLSLSDDELFAPPQGVDDYQVLLVPGWNYANNGHITGSDFAAPRRLLDRLGVDHQLVLVPSNGSVMQSAEEIAASILRHSGAGRKIVMVGASAAGPSIHYTLGSRLRHDQLGDVVAWINLGGILHGSPLIDRFQRYPKKLFFDMALILMGWEHDEVMTMSAAASRRRVGELELPPELVVINYLGLSLTGSLSSLSTYKYPIIADEGPNDGLTPLVDIIAPNSTTLVATQSDHYFGEDPEIDRKTIAIVKTVLDMIRSTAER